MKKNVTLLILVLLSFGVRAQTITKLTVSTVSGTVCPGSPTYYEVSVPSHLTTCEITWSATNGTATRDQNDQRKAHVAWADTPGAIGIVTATFNACNNEGNNGTAANKSELILSVKNQAWGSYGTSANIDYCTKAPVLVTVPKMYVQGTGGIGQPPLTEVAYYWTIPSGADGWREVGTLRTGSFGTSTNFISIEPINCSKPGQVTVYGTLAGAGPFCNSAEKSATATISLNGANPVVTVGPDPGFSGVITCSTTPITFYATTNVALGCISSYSWTYPASWSLVSQSANAITLSPTGIPADSNPIKATVNMSCGSVIQSGNYIPPYIAPTIAGTNTVCSSSASYSVPNVSGASWSSGNINKLTINGSGIATRVGSSTGEVVIYAHFSCGAPSISKTLWLGTPTVAIVGPPYYVCPDPTLWHTFYSYVSGNPTSYSWSIPGDAIAHNDIIWHQTLQLMFDSDPPVFFPYDTRHLSLTVYNQCGWTTEYHTIQFPCCCIYPFSQFSISPNPADDYVEIMLEEKASVEITDNTGESKIDKTETKYLVRIYDMGRFPVYETEKGTPSFTLPTRTLKDGTYIIHIEDNDGIRHHKRLVVKH